MNENYDIDIQSEHTLMMVGYHFTIGIIELTNAMLSSKQDKDDIDDVNRKYDALWNAYKEACDRMQRCAYDKA